MPRFTKLNRWWTLILTLCLGVALVTSFASRASAESLLLDELGGKTWSGGGPSPSGEGGPDTPTPSAMRRARPIAGGQAAAGISTSRVAGDGRRVDGVMMWQFRVVMQTLRLWGFGRF